MDVDSLAKSKGKGKSDKGKGKGKSKGKDKGKNSQSSYKNSWSQQSWNQQSWQKNSSKGKGKKDQDKGKGKGDQGKGRKVSNVESDAWAQEQQPSAASTGDQPEPEVTAVYTLEEAMSPKPETRQEPRQSESHRGRSPRRAALQAPSKGTVTRSAMLLAQSALASASGSNAELFGKMISQAEKAVEEAKTKGIEANQALKDRQEDLAQLKAEAEHNRAEVREAMAKVRAEGRATSAPAIPSRRLRADLESGVHARAAKKADKDRQRAASHRASTGRDRTASWKRFETGDFWSR